MNDDVWQPWKLKKWFGKFFLKHACTFYARNCNNTLWKCKIIPLLLKSSLVVQEDYPRVRAILLLLSDDYVRSTNEDARKGGAVALAACAIGLKKANERRRDVMECRDLILASVVHACQDHSQVSGG